VSSRSAQELFEESKETRCLRMRALHDLRVISQKARNFLNNIMFKG